MGKNSGSISALTNLFGLITTQPDVYLGIERAMNWTLCRDLHEFLSLFRRQRAGQLNVDVDSIEHPSLRLAFFAILRVNARMRK